MTSADVYVALDAVEEGVELAWALSVLEAAGVLQSAWPPAASSPRRRWRGCKHRSLSGAFGKNQSGSGSSASVIVKTRSGSNSQYASFSGVGADTVSKRGSETQRCATSFSGVGFLGRIEWI
jgi:hypothetical protein